MSPSADETSRYVADDDPLRPAIEAALEEFVRRAPSAAKSPMIAAVRAAAPHVPVSPEVQAVLDAAAGLWRQFIRRYPPIDLSTQSLDAFADAMEALENRKA